MERSRTRIFVYLLGGCWTAMAGAFAALVLASGFTPNATAVCVLFIGVLYFVGLAAVRGSARLAVGEKTPKGLEASSGGDTSGHRDAEQLEEGLKQARAMARKAEVASSAKSVFLAKMSHEIRTPLNAVLGISSILRQTELSDEQRELVEVIHASGDALLSIVNDILDFSKIEAGKIQLSKVEFSLASLFEDVERMSSLQAREKGLDFVVDLLEEVPASFRADERRLGQILTNLCSNAIKFTEKGRVTLKAELMKRQERLAVVRFAVSDTGIGLEEEEQSRIFDAFYQTDGSFTRQHGGAGLGLAITKQLVEAMGGTLEVESAPGQGATFSFVLDLEIGQSRIPVAPERNRPRNLSILIVGEEPQAQIGLLDCIADRAGKVVCVEAGRDGWVKYLQFADRAPFDAVIVNLNSKDSEVRGLIRRIRAQEDLSQPGIVGLISQNEGDVDVFFDEGYDAVLRMPAGKSLLCEALDAVVDNKKTQDEERTSKPSMVTEATLRTARFVGVRLLVAEDNRVNQKVVCKILERCGAAVTVVSNGLEAIEQLKTEKYDLVIMDVQMPVLDGIGATQAIRDGRAGPHAREIPIIALTAHAVKGDEERFIGAGMDAYLAKPVEPQTLIKVVERQRDTQGKGVGPGEKVN